MLSYFSKIILIAGWLLTFAGLGFGQEFPCLDLKTGKLSFQKYSKKTFFDDCANRVPKSEQAAVAELTISGHVTHQNGVRLSGVTMTLSNLNGGAARTVVTDENGVYRFSNLAAGRYQLTPTRANYEFFPPSVIWEGIVEDAIQNFIAAGPPPDQPPVDANTPPLAWSNYYDSTTKLADYNAMLGRDAEGNIYVGGTSYANYEEGNTDIVVYKLDANGNRLWAKTFNGAGNYKDGLEDLAVDAGGNVYLTGYSYSGGANAAERSYNFAVLKYNTSGNLLWTKYYDGNVGYNDMPTSLKIDAAGSVYVTGSSWGVGTYSNYVTVKYDTNGNQLWARRFAGGSGEIPYEVEVDAAGNVYITGTSNHSAMGESEDIVTIKYSPDGQQLWLNRYNSATEERPEGFKDEGFELEINAAGDVLILGQTDLNNENKILLHKITGVTGTTAWTKSFSPTSGQPSGNRAASASAMKLDADGNIIITGMTSDFYSYNVDSFVGKFDANGLIQWLETYDGPADDDFDGDPKLALDTNGNVYVGITSEGFSNPDMQIVKYFADGQKDWTHRFGNPFFGGDGFLDWRADAAQTTMLVDEQGGVYVAGNSFIPEQSNDLVAFKLEPNAQNRAAAYDFDGDSKADIAVFRPENGTWYVLKSSDGGFSAMQWGMATDKLIPADYDGDGKTDVGVYRDGVWYVQKSSDQSFLFNQFGVSDDKPIPADFDNDGRADLNVYRQGTWHSLQSSDNAYKAVQFGANGDQPIPSDYDSNRRSDIAVFRNGSWFVKYQKELPLNSAQFGAASDKPVPADYDGDRKTDYAVFRDGNWFVWESRTNSMRVLQWGQLGDVPVPADYDGDRKTDFAVYRQGAWYILRSKDNKLAAMQFGLPTDVPIPAAYTR